MKKRTIFIIAAAVVVYVLLLILLTLCEGMEPDANIRSFWDAFWYSLVTMTTVGYGDHYPVSVVGRLIGLVFLILSIGVLAAVLYSLAALIRTKLMPFIRLQLSHGKTCCFFSELNEASAALAQDLIRRDPKKRVFFCGITEEEKNKYSISYKNLLFRAQNICETVRTAVGKDNENAGFIQVFLISENMLDNYAAAAALNDLPVKIYCRALETERLPGVSFFEMDECCARQYWQTHPIQKGERRIVLIGDGSLARAILNQAVTVNCRIPFASSSYHMFGDWTDYRNFHPGLSRVFCMNREAAGRDCLIFHEEKWNENSQLLCKADRIIFCANDARENLINVALAKRYFPLNAQTHSAALNSAEGDDSFGDAASLFTEELVVKSSLDAQARAMHEAYCKSVGDLDHPWESLSPFLKESNRSAADHKMTKIRLLMPEEQPLAADEKTCAEAYARWKEAEDKDLYRRNEHERWLRFHCLNNWRYGPVRDNKNRIHPCIVDYIDLSEKEKIKDDNAWEQIGQVFPSE